MSFAVKKSGVRIGSMNIDEDGRFTLNLRAEYEFSWTEDELQLSYLHQAGDTKTTYSTTIASLAELYNMSQNGETIVLTK